MTASMVDTYSDYDLNPDSCQYYDVHKFNGMFTGKRNFFIMNFNIRSFNANFDDFSVFVEELTIQPHILVLTETWFLDMRAENIPGYNGYHCCRSSESSGPGGGVSIFVRKSLNAKIIFESSESLPAIEIVHLKIMCNTFSALHLLAIYRPPNSSFITDFIQKLDVELGSLPNNNGIVLIGDLNINGLVCGQNTSNLFDLFNTYSLNPHIILPTTPNHNGSNASQIDHLWSNIEKQFEAGIFDSVKITDHFANFVIFETELPGKPEKIIFRDHSETCINSMVDKITNFRLFFPLLTANRNFNSKFDLFHDEILNIYKSSCPLKTKIYPTENLRKPWITNDIKIRIQRKNYLFKRYKNGALPFETYNRYKLETEKILKKSKSSYLIRKYNDCRGDSAGSWKLTNSLLNKPKSSQIAFETIDGYTTVNGGEDVCNIFNQHFLQAGHNLAAGIPNNHTDPLVYMGQRNQNTFYFAHSSPDEIVNMIMSFKNKKTSTENIPVIILKKVSNTLAPLLAELFNESIEFGIFPEKLKLGRVIPLHKSGTRKSVANFRPITTLSIFSKLFEKLVHKRLISFIKKYKILNENQFGFQKQKGTGDAILEFLDNAFESLNNNNFLLTIYLDFSKAFDTIPFGILLKKLQHYGFRGNIAKWIESFLCGRRQYVCIETYCSEIVETTLGSPQGSTLSPLLFLLYINDMYKSLNDIKILHYADDSTLYFEFPRGENCSPLVNLELNSLNSWLLTNKLFLNINKTKYMIINNKKNPDNLTLKIGDSQIERTDVHNFLGVQLDEKLTFSAHCNKLSSKISRNIGVIRKLSYVVPKSILRNLHFAFVNSHIVYSIISYGSATNTATNRLSKLVDKSIKINSGSNRISINVYRQQNLFGFSLTHQYFSIIKMYQILRMNLHHYFIEKIDRFQISHEHSTRFASGELFTLPFMRHNKCQRSFLYRGLQFWNQLPVSIRNLEKLEPFKRALHKYLLR